MKSPVNHIIDADIKGFFDNVEHDWLMRCVEQRISDKSRKGYFKVGRKTARKKYSAKIKEMNQWLKAVRNTSHPESWWPVLLKSKTTTKTALVYLKLALESL